MYQSGRNLDSVFYKANIDSPYDTVITLLGIYLREMKTYVHTRNCVQMLIAILYLIAKTWRKGKCPIVVERINIAVRRKTLLLQPPIYKGRERVSGTRG